MAAETPPDASPGGASERPAARRSATRRFGSRSSASSEWSRGAGQTPRPAVHLPLRSSPAPVRARRSGPGPAARRAEAAQEPSPRREETSTRAVQVRAAPRARSEGGKRHEAEGAREGRRTSRRHRPGRRGARTARRTPAPRSGRAPPARPLPRPSGHDGRATVRDESASPCTRLSRW
jgi:hypothetical protein